jgi:hypothetical protein
VEGAIDLSEVLSRQQEWVYGSGSSGPRGH